MNCIRKILLYSSSFLPVLSILLLKDLLLTLSEFGKNFYKTAEFIYIEVWLGIIIIISIFLWIMLNNEKHLGGNRYNVLKVENKAADYYLQYFSFFILSFVSITLTDPTDIIVLIFLLLLLGIVYIRNDLYFINPTISILYGHIYKLEVQADNKIKSITVISKDKIYSGDLIKARISESDICFAKVQK